jgi:uncharacterized protein involved in cysteine biosynthesis
MLNFSKQILEQHSSSIIRGFSIFSSGVSHSFKKKKLLLLALLPIIIAALCLTFFYAPLYSFILSALEARLISQSQFNFWGGGALLWLVNLIVKVFSAIFSFIFFYILLQIVYIPFCSFLAEAVLREKGIVKVEGLTGMMAYNASMLKIGIMKAALLTLVGLVLFASSFLPLLSFLPFYFAMLILAYDSFDYGLELYGLNLSQRSTYFQKEFFMLNGHAGVLFLMSFVPGLLLLTLPFSVIGASLKLGEVYEVKRKVT